MMSSTAKDEYGEITAPGTIRFQRVLPGPLERVWAYITESEKRGRWFASGEWELEPGGRAPLNFHHADLTPHDETVPEKFKDIENGVSFECKVHRCEPPHRVSILWTESWGETEVTFELEERDDGKVLLTLTHGPLTGDGMRDAGPGWHVHLAILTACLEDREPAPFWEAITRLEAEYTERFRD